MSDEFVRTRSWRAYLLVASGVSLAFVGAIWWAFDANPTLGKVLLSIGLLIAVSAHLLSGLLAGGRGRGLVPLSVLVFVFAAMELWLALVAIQANAAPHLG